MIPRHVSDCVKLLLQVAVILMVAFSTPRTKQCKLTTTESDGSVIIRNTGIKLCQQKCIEIGQNVSAQYIIDTLTCRLSGAELGKTKTKKGYIGLARNHSDVSAGSCSPKCNFGQKCVIRSGKSVCFQDEKNVPEKSPQHEVDKEDTMATSPLHDACRKGNLTRVRSILSRGLVDVNSRDVNHGKTPLMVAAQEGHCRIFDFLIEKWADMSVLDNDGKNILYWACNGGHVDMVQCILPHYGVIINHKELTPLLQAAMLGYRQVCEFLVCMGANVSQVDDNGDSALHMACLWRHLDVVKYLLLLPSVDINVRGKGGMTPLMVTLYHNYSDIGQLLVSRGANLSQVDDDGDNVLHIACRQGRLHMLKVLLSKGSVDINSRGNSGRTPLMNAAYYGERKVFDLLISEGCLTHLVDDDGYNILHLACLKRHVGMVKHIISQHLTDVNARGKKGRTAAMVTDNIYGRIRIFNFLVSRGCPVK